MVISEKFSVLSFLNDLSIVGYNDISILYLE